MNQFGNALGKKFIENKESVRIREFELGGHTFKVKVPLTVETDAVYARLKELDEAKLEAYYQDIAKDLLEQKDNVPEGANILYTDNDVIIEGRSMRDAAKNKLLTEVRITEMFRLLVPEDKDFDMGTITYKDIDELFPLPIQMAVVDEIGKVISFDYGKTKEK